jgi:hypothetical protein
VRFGVRGEWKWRTKGEWTRIHNDQTASCDQADGNLRCLIA